MPYKKNLQYESIRKISNIVTTVTNSVIDKPKIETLKLNVFRKVTEILDLLI